MGVRLPCRVEALARHYGESSDLVGTYAWYNRNSEYRSQPVGSLKPNEWGFHDMLGNVSEWTHDVYRLYMKPADRRKRHESGAADRLPVPSTPNAPRPGPRVHLIPRVVTMVFASPGHSIEPGVAR